MNKTEFLAQLKFDPQKRGFVGVEREFFLTDAAGRPVPRAMEFLPLTQDHLQGAHNKAWTYELSACQVEHRTAPIVDESELGRELAMATIEGMLVAEELGCTLSSLPIAPEDMPLDVYPDERYHTIAATLPVETLRAACRVAGVHIHLGASDIDDAIDIHERLCANLDLLCTVGDRSGGARLETYKRMAKRWRPYPYKGHTNGIRRERFLRHAVEQGFAENPRSCYHLIRISIHGTVELRMFDMTENIEEILRWVWLARKIAFG